MVRPACAVAVVLAASAQEGLDLAPFARPCCAEDGHQLQTTFDYAHPPGLVRRADGGWVYGLQSAEERDIAEIRVRFNATTPPATPAVQYWFRNWPLPRPQSHTVEDRVDDPWQGAWITARTGVRCDGPVCRLGFLPLEAGENPNAKNLPGVRCRRTLKVRLLFAAGERPPVESVEVFSESRLKRFPLRVRVPGAPPHWEAYNGWIRSVRRAGRDTLVTVDGADPQPPGSHDVTIVKVRSAKGTFSFAPADAQIGPMYLPDFDAYIAVAEDRTPSSAPRSRRAGASANVS